MARQASTYAPLFPRAPAGAFGPAIPVTPPRPYLVLGPIARRLMVEQGYAAVKRNARLAKTQVAARVGARVGR